MLQRSAELARLVEAHRSERVVVCGMGGSSLAPLVLGRAYGAPLEVLDTTHPAAVRRLEVDGALFVISSKSGSTVETRCHFDHLWDRTGKRADAFLVITDPGSPLEQLAKQRGIEAVAGEPTIGGRYSALSVFGLVPVALAGVDLRRAARARRGDARRLPARRRESRPGARPRAGGRLGGGPRQGRLRESGRLRAVARAADRRVDGQGWPGARAGGGRVRGRRRPAARGDRHLRAGRPRCRVLPLRAGDGGRRRDPRRQPLRPAERRGGQGARRGPSSIPDMSQGQSLDQRRDVEDAARQASGRGTTSRSRRSSIPIASTSSSRSSSGRAPPAASSPSASARAICTRQDSCTRAGPPTGHFIQVVDDTGKDVSIPKRKFGFRRLIEAQAAGDYEALKARGRPIVRVKLEDL